MYRMKEPLNLRFAAGEHIAVVGANGAGKSLLIDTLTGRYPLLMNEVKYDFPPLPLLWHLIISNVSLFVILMAMRTGIIITSSGGMHMTWMILLGT